MLLRRYDDGAGKRSGADVADLSHFRSMLEDLHARNVRAVSPARIPIYLKIVDTLIRAGRSGSRGSVGHRAGAGRELRSESQNRAIGSRRVRATRPG